MKICQQTESGHSVPMKAQYDKYLTTLKMKIHFIILLTQDLLALKYQNIVLLNYEEIYYT